MSNNASGHQSSSTDLSLPTGHRSTQSNRSGSDSSSEVSQLGNSRRPNRNSSQRTLDRLNDAISKMRNRVFYRIHVDIFNANRRAILTKLRDCIEYTLETLKFDWYVIYTLPWTIYLITITANELYFSISGIHL